MRPCLLIDAFAQRAFAGNPAMVVWLDRRDALPDAMLQAIAAEMKQSETAFIAPCKHAGTFDLRWFTPVCEVALCGHATLAGAHALRVWGHVTTDATVRFVTRFSGELLCRFVGGQIEMDFPATPAAACVCPADATEVLGVAGPVTCVGGTTMNLTLALPDENQIIHARPDLSRLRTWHDVGVTITAAANEADIDFVSRFFAPAAGIDEDAVTGSAHCTLAPYWSRRLNKTTLVAAQRSARGGQLELTCRGDRVLIRGAAVTVLSGQIEL